MASRRHTKNISSEGLCGHVVLQEPAEVGVVVVCGLEPGVETREGLGVKARVFERNVDLDGGHGPTQTSEFFGDRHRELGNGGLLERRGGTADGKRRACGSWCSGGSLHNVSGGSGELGVHDGWREESFVRCLGFALRE